MSSDGIYDFKKDVRKYIIVFVALAALTVVTVAASYIEAGNTTGIMIALFIAIVKASLVACIFMHLIAEKKLIFIVLVLTAAFFIGLMLLPLAQHHGALYGTEFTP